MLQNVIRSGLKKIPTYSFLSIKEHFQICEKKSVAFPGFQRPLDTLINFIEKMFPNFS